MRDFRGIRPFSGGLRMRPHKALSTADPITTLTVPARLVIAMAQSAGPAAHAAVGVGDQVRRGQVIGSALDRGSVAVHASASGTVVGLEERLVPQGARLAKSLCVVIDTAHGARDMTPPVRSWPRTLEARLQAIRNAGIVGLGGAAFPTAAKLGSSRRCHTLILNGVECEPYISCDDRLMRERADEILRGASVMAELLGARQCIVAIERDKVASLQSMRAASSRRGDGRFSIASVAPIYPAGGERQLIESLLGSEVPAGGYPADIGVICQNVGTAFALDGFVTRGEPLLTRVVTLTGHGLRRPQNVEAPIGASICDLLHHCGGLRADATQLILGGNMMGYALPTDDIPVTKSTNCIIAMTPSETRADGLEWPCIRCGECARSCPARLMPQELLRAARDMDVDALEALAVDACIECGCCDVVCPSHIPLTAAFRQGKRELETVREHRHRASAADERFARRVARESIVTVDATRAQTELRAAVTGDPSARQSAIAAAIRRARGRRMDSDSDPDPGPGRR